MAVAEHHEDDCFLPNEFLSDDFFAERDEDNSKTSITGTSPQSTLGGIEVFSFSSNDSPNGPSQSPSPPSTPFRPPRDDALDLLYAAVGQVERLNLNDDNPKHRKHTIMDNFCPYQEELMKQQAARFYQLRSQQLMKMQRQQYANAVWGWKRQNRSNAVSSLPLPPSERPLLRNLHGLQPGHAIFFNGCVRMQSKGTGVFLPRRIGVPGEPKKQHSKNPCPFLLPARVVQALNLNVEDTGARRPQMPGCYVGGNEAIMGQSNLKRILHYHQRRQAAGLGTGPEISLPQEWTY